MNDTNCFEKLSPYLEWIQKVCNAKNIIISNDITQIVESKLFRISSDIGDLYFKKMGSFIVDELAFTHKLMQLELISQPEWVGYDIDMKLYLMRDMGGSDLSLIQQMDMQTAINMFVSLSRIQKDSIQYVKSGDICGVDYRISTMLEEMKDLPEIAYAMLLNTPYKLARCEADKLKQNIEHVRAVLESLENICLPDTIHHGDLGTYNVRVVDEKSIFYDWGCGGVSHPFFDTFRLLYSIRGKIPTDIPAKKIIVNAYIQEWLDYGSYEEIMKIFTAIDGLAGFYMAYVKYIRARNEHFSFDDKTGKTRAAALDMRYSTTATYLREIATNNFQT